MIHPVWSTTTCDFPGAGLYIGLAPRYEHLIVARMFSPKQMRLMTGAHTQLGNNHTMCPLEYYAVRDPSIVRVVPVDSPPLPNGFRHMKLKFQFDNPHRLQDAVSVGNSCGSDISGFVLTVGLPTAHEDDFYRRAIDEHPGQRFGELYARARDLGCPADE